MRVPGKVSCEIILQEVCTSAYNIHSTSTHSYLSIPTVLIYVFKLSIPPAGWMAATSTDLLSQVILTTLPALTTALASISLTLLKNPNKCK
jgi:hypothetical protein